MLARLALCTCFWAGLAYAAHGHWTDHYPSAGDTRCCHQYQDCRPVKARILRQTATTVVFEADGVQYELPAQSFHLSEDTQDWLCAATVWKQGERLLRPRCLFVFPGS